ncbi:MAG: zeta toxin family protein [Burkholderiales bacterium]|nr:zeta toxin family protein [Burkholderiales bacterium]
MSMNEQETRIEAAALDYARVNKKTIAKRLTDPHQYPPEKNPVSVFMAGSPGAGKTEASIELLKETGGGAVIRIDPDDLRNEFPDYSGTNAWLFQKAVSVLVDRIHDMALEQDQSFLLDGTLSHYDVAKRNIERSLKRGRSVQILYVYQEPQLAWEFVQARETQEGRRIRPETFIDQYFAARDVVNRLKREFSKNIGVDLLLKNNDNSRRLYQAGIDQIDHHIPEKYSRADVERILKSS